jgi:hypothetical protein
MVRSSLAKKTKAQLFLAATLLTIGSAQTVPAKFVAFNGFLRAVKQANADKFLASPDSKVVDAPSFEEMRQHILTLYRGVHVNHSYVLGPQTFDCIPVDEQPSVRLLGLNRIAPAPPAGSSNPSQPMRRVTPEELSHFRTLREFFKKGPIEAGSAPSPPAQ